MSKFCPHCGCEYGKEGSHDKNVEFCTKSGLPLAETQAETNLVSKCPHRDYCDCYDYGDRVDCPLFAPDLPYCWRAGYRFPGAVLGREIHWVRTLFWTLMLACGLILLLRYLLGVPKPYKDISFEDIWLSLVIYVVLFVVSFLIVLYYGKAESSHAYYKFKGRFHSDEYSKYIERWWITQIYKNYYFRYPLDYWSINEMILWCFLAFIFPLFGWICGGMNMRKTHNSEGHRKQALVLIIISSVSFALSIVFMMFVMYLGVVAGK